MRQLIVLFLNAVCIDFLVFRVFIWSTMNNVGIEENIVIRFILGSPPSSGGTCTTSSQRATVRRSASISTSRSCPTTKSWRSGCSSGTLRDRSEQKHLKSSIKYVTHSTSNLFYYSSLIICLFIQVAKFFQTLFFDI